MGSVSRAGSKAARATRAATVWVFIVLKSNQSHASIASVSLIIDLFKNYVVILQRVSRLIIRRREWAWRRDACWTCAGNVRWPFFVRTTKGHWGSYATKESWSVTIKYRLWPAGRDKWVDNFGVQTKRQENKRVSAVINPFDRGGSNAVHNTDRHGCILRTGRDEETQSRPKQTNGCLVVELNHRLELSCQSYGCQTQYDCIWSFRGLLGANSCAC